MLHFMSGKCCSRGVHTIGDPAILDSTCVRLKIFKNVFPKAIILAATWSIGEILTAIQVFGLP